MKHLFEREHVDTIKSKIGIGSTEPLIGIVDGTECIIKTYNNNESNRVLINELVCYLLAKELELPIPDFGTCIIDKNTFIDKSVNLTAENHGLGFFTRRINRAMQISGPAQLIKIPNFKDLLPKIIIFDHLVYNKDRHKGNLLLSISKSKKEIYLIDHSHVFNLETLWDSIQLQRCIKECDYKDTKILEYNSYLYGIFKEVMNITITELNNAYLYFASKINNSTFDKIMLNIPLEWDTTRNELNILSNYLNYRFANLSKMCYLIDEYLNSRR